MIITKKHVGRRQFLRGAMGVAIGLPFLDAMVPALSAQMRTAANAPLRFGCVYVPNGTIPIEWECKGVGTEFELSPVLKALEPFRNQLVSVSGLFQTNPTGSAHMTASAMWLNGVRPNPGDTLSAATTVDQLIAAKIGQETPLPSREFGTEDMSTSIGNCDTGYSCLYFNALSWRTPTMPLPVEINPRVMFEQLFGDTGTTAQRLARFQQKRSMLDSVAEETARLQRQLGSQDRTRLGEYLDNIREVERRIQKAEQHTNTTLNVPAAPSGVPESFDEYVALLFDMQLIAYQADLTRVFTFLVGHEGSNRGYPQIGVPESHHYISHHGGHADIIAQHVKINQYHVSLFVKFLEKMRATPDGDGSLLDHSMILYGSGMSEGNNHDRRNLPLVIVGGANGKIKGGRHLQYPNTPMPNLLLTLADKAGVHVDKMGYSTGEIDL